MDSFEALLSRLDSLSRGARDRAVAHWVAEADGAAVDAALATLGIRARNSDGAKSAKDPRAGAHIDGAKDPGSGARGGDAPDPGWDEKAGRSQADRGDAWHRALGVFIAGLAGRSGYVLAALADPSLTVRRVAVSHATRRIGDVPAIVAATLAAVPATRVAVAAAAARHRRVDLAAPLAEALVAAGALPAARPLFEWCDEAVVRRVVSEHGVGAVRWSRTAARYPDFALSALRRELEQATSQSAIAIAWTPFGGAMPALVQQRPDEVLALWEAFGPTAWPPASFASCWPWLLRAAPEQVARLWCRVVAATPSAALPKAILRRAGRLPERALLRLAAALAPSVASLTALLAALPPSRRAAVWAAAHEGVDGRSAVWPETLLAVLPHGLRQAEARRMLSLPEVAKDPARVLAVSSCLSLAEALPALDARARAARGEDRAVGWTLRVACNAYNRQGLDATLEAMRRLANEQDPVRCAALGALARVPVRLFVPEHAPLLAEFVRYAVDARDTSSSTRAALQSLAQRLLVAWAHTPNAELFQTSLQMMLKLAEHRPSLTFPSLRHGLRRGAERPLVDRLLPWLQKEVAREFNGNVLGLAAALGRRAWAHEALQAVLQSVVFTARSSSSWQRQNAAELWLADPRRRDERVRAVLDFDESSVVLPAVWRHVHRRRQDWLDPFLQGRVLRGRFSSAKAGWLFPADGGFGAWLPRQQRVFAETLRAFMRDLGQHVVARAAVVRKLAALPASRVADLEALTKHDEVFIAEAALGALVWLDEPADGLRLLLAGLDSDRARVAMYAMPRLARLVPDATLFATLRELLEREQLKITVHKEAVRLLGGLRLEGVGELLWQAWSRPAVHRDVRVAFVHAARRRLVEARSWSMLEAAAAHPERDVAQAVLQADRAEVAPGSRARYAGLVLGLAGHPAPEVQKALLVHLAEPAGWGSELPANAVAVTCAVLAARQSDVPWAEAARAAACLAVTPEAVAELERTLLALAQRMLAEPHETAPDEEDLPSQRRLEAVCAALAATPAGDRPRTRDARAAARRCLGASPAWLWDELIALGLADLAIVPQAAATAPTDWTVGPQSASAPTAPASASSATEALRALAAIAPSPEAASALARLVAAWAQDPTRACAADDLLTLARCLRVGPERWVALGLVQATGRRFGWGPGARALLAELRRDPLTAAAARRVHVC